MHPDKWQEKHKDSSTWLLAWRCRRWSYPCTNSLTSLLLSPMRTSSMLPGRLDSSQTSETPRRGIYTWLHITHLCCLFLAESNQKQVDRDTNLQNTLHLCGIFAQRDDEYAAGGGCTWSRCYISSRACACSHTSGSANHKHMPKVPTRSSCHLRGSRARLTVEVRDVIGIYVVHAYAP